MGSSESDLMLLGNIATIVGAAAGILGGVGAAAGLAAFFGAGGALS
ncbi:hypothetical protein JO861_16485 [Rhodococcus hoagii]|nr:hypothetical protein [Prescottella equi]MBM9838145.1 hypothetical protein [Prescottella equi]NKS77794.1 hypothetical protein [Prescottella equi]UNQ39074.1 hypothetical protein MPC38_20660 [Prescottella equi]